MTADSESMESRCRENSFHPRPEAENYLHLFLIGGICLVILFSTIVSSVFLCIDVEVLRRDFKSDMEEFGALTDQAWSELMHIQPRPEKPVSPFLVGVRVKRQYDSNPYDSSSPVSQQPQVGTPPPAPRSEQCRKFWCS